MKLKFATLITVAKKASYDGETTINQQKSTEINW